jgi:hypothetical protein
MLQNFFLAPEDTECSLRFCRRDYSMYVFVVWLLRNKTKGKTNLQKTKSDRGFLATPLKMKHLASSVKRFETEVPGDA